MIFVTFFSTRFDADPDVDADVETPEPNLSFKKDDPRLGKKLSRVFSEDYAKTNKTILDPRGEATNQWNQLFLIAALISLAVDPLFFYLPIIKENTCLDEDITLKITLTVIRTIVDIFYAIKIYVRFRTAYVAPSSRLLGRGELILDSSSISERYLKGEFWLDFLATLPIPQVVTWFHIVDKTEMMSTKTSVLYIIMIQFFLRLYLTFSLGTHISKQAGLVANVAWVGAAYNLVLFMLAAHVCSKLLCSKCVTNPTVFYLFLVIFL